MRHILFFFGIIFCLTSCQKKYTYSDYLQNDNVSYAGARSSSYGVHPFPDWECWESGIKEINQQFPNSQPAALWIVGVLGHDSKDCRLEFPVDTNQYKNITCLSYDKHEQYLTHFDTTGIKVYLQVEPAMANVDTLIKLVLDHYGHHSSVIGFGVDAEWHRYTKTNDWGVKIDDKAAKRWEELVKSYNNEYQLFLKHWDRRWMPPRYRGDIIFVDDSQQFKNKNHMLKEFANYWGDYFYPNTVFYQIGYPADKTHWEKFDNPIKRWGSSIANYHKQRVGIFWVDFTLKETVQHFREGTGFIRGTKLYKTDQKMASLFHNLKQAKINTLVASRELNANLTFRELARENQMQRFLIFPTFYAPDYLKTHPNHYAILNNGKKAHQEWVRFACPSRQEFRNHRIKQLQKWIKKYNPDGLSIDFIRHFAYWEKIYPGTSQNELTNSCFCSNCMQKFEDHLNQTIPADSPEDYYHWITTHQKDKWITWKSDLITSMVKELTTAAREINPDILINIHMVPWRETDFNNARNEVLGQDIQALAKYADYLSPMTYAHMVKQPAHWIHSVVREMHDQTNCTIVPSIQVSKAYLDDPIHAKQFSQYLYHSVKYPSSGVVLWSWERLDKTKMDLLNNF